MKFVIQESGEQMKSTLDKLMDVQQQYPANSLSNVVLKFAEIHEMLEKKFPGENLKWYDEQAFSRLDTYYKAWKVNVHQ